MWSHGQQFLQRGAGSGHVSDPPKTVGDEATGEAHLDLSSSAEPPTAWSVVRVGQYQIAKWKWVGTSYKNPSDKFIPSRSK